MACPAGPSHFFQIVNMAIAVFFKNGTLLYGPVNTHTLWNGFGGECETHNDGDGIILYDALIQRWLVSQFAIARPVFRQCVAISMSPDPLGAYYRYSFSYAGFPDYPKLSVWPDGEACSYWRLILRETGELPRATRD
jgi:hypothetical protein